jgi:hypothetical protein
MKMLEKQCIREQKTNLQIFLAASTSNFVKHINELAGHGCAK